MTTLASYGRLYKAHGFKRVWCHVWDVERFDWQYGVDTATWLPLNAYQGDVEDAKHYQASFTSELKRVFRMTRALVHADHYGFYDLGCGKGKALILAERVLKPKVCVGVELNPELVKIGEENIEKTNTKAEIIECRAEEFEEYQPYSVVYICDPFGEKTLGQILSNLNKACTDAILIYNNPVYDVSKYGFTTIAETDGWHQNYRTSIFRSGAVS